MKGSTRVKMEKLAAELIPEGRARRLQSGADGAWRAGMHAESAALPSLAR